MKIHENLIITGESPEGILEVAVSYSDLSEVQPIQIENETENEKEKENIENDNANIEIGNAEEDNVGTEKEKFPCKTGRCKKVFDSEIKLNQHRIKKHPTERKFKCNFCQKTFMLLENVRSHEKNKRSGCSYSNVRVLATILT